MKLIAFSLVNIAFAMTAGTASAQADHGAAPADPAVTAIADSPASYDQQYQAARALSNAGRREEAIQAFSDLLLRSPGNADVLLGRGQVYARMGRWPEAEADLLAVTSSSPDYADAWSALGDMYMWSARPRQAIDPFARLIDLRPTDPAPRIARGRAYRATGDYAAARADFEAARALGADAGQVDGFLLSLMPRVSNPDASVPSGFPWSAIVGASWTEFSPSRNGWSDDILSVRRHFERGSLALESVDVRRFGSSDHAWALDGYLDLWNRAYVNLRYQQGPAATLYPDRSYYAELFQGTGRGWELSSSYSHLEFDSSNVDIYGIGVGKYAGNYYIRLRHLYIPGNGSHSNSDRLLLRYYYAGDGDNYFEVSAGAGTTDADTPGSPGASTQTNTSTFGVALAKFPTPRWGFKIGADYGHESSSFDSRSISGKLYLRW